MKRIFQDIILVVLFIIAGISTFIFTGSKYEYYVRSIPGLLTGTYFLLAYFYPDANDIFKGLIWFCTHFSTNPGRKMALFYAVLF